MKERINLNSDALQLRRRLGEDPNSPIDIFSIINSHKGITLIFYPMSLNISGMCGRIDSTDSYIAINSNHTYGRQRFTLAHELYHLNFQEKFNRIVCGTVLDGKKDEEEMNADAFASFFLAPYESLRIFIFENLEKQKGQPLEIEDIVYTEQYFGMSRHATLYRLRWEGFDFQQKIEEMKGNVITSARMLGFDDKLYTRSSADREFFTTGRYINLAEKLREKGIISKGKYEELLLEAYRSDIVYNLPAEGEEIYD